MAKKIQAYIKLQIKSGQANPSPPIGPALGQHGVNIVEFCKEFNSRTQKMEQGVPLPILITVYSDRSITFVIKTPSTSFLLRKAAQAKNVSSKNRTVEEATTTSSVICRKQLEEIAEIKKSDLTAANLGAAIRTIAGSARSMGLKTEDCHDG